MKKFTLLATLMGGFILSQAQTAVTIQQIQTVSPQTLATCVDSSSPEGQQVKVRGVVVMDAGLAQAASGRNLWIQAGTGPWSGLDIFDAAAVDLDGLVAGDSVELTGTVEEFAPTGGPKAESELISITAVNIIGSGNPVQSTLVNLGDLNDNTQLNILSTGEQYEGVYVELQNVEVTAVVYFSNNTRVSFNVKDANGNLINVSDRFLAQRLPASGGNFVPPTVGTIYTSLKGILIHSPNGCKNYNGRGYELHPFSSADYQVLQGFSPPTISGIMNSPAAPTSSQSVTIQATIADADGTVDSAKVYYAVGVSNTNYIPLMMTGAASTYTATIPAQANGSFVKYYISAWDNDQLIATQPNVPGNLNPKAYVVADNGLTIKDIQYTPFVDGNSIYRDQTVTVTGVVTASAQPGNLGYVFIQQEGQLGWGGVMCIGNNALSTLVVGDKVTVTGDVKESFGCTRIENISNIVSAGTGSINPLTLDPDVFSTYDFAANEQYESMLIELANPAMNGKVYIINTNADAPANFAEYRVGKDALLPDNGCRVIAGRQTGSAYSSLNVSYVNDSSWALTDGIMNVPVEVVQYGDCMESVTGIIYYSFSNMKLLPRNNGDYVNYDAGCDGISAIDNRNLAEVKVYPSPANGEIHVDYEFSYNAKATLQLVDMMGRTVYAQTLSGAQGAQVLSTAAIVNGTYLIRITDGNNLLFIDKVVVLK
ncbi:MAG: T9SS type A sorting domain-containing protein [Bacteroidia bacterium]|nr:T9SS type A sorting domain-containing protein [Bacteroidia bacterium]